MQTSRGGARNRNSVPRDHPSQPAAASAQSAFLCGAVVDPVEEELERTVRLRAEQDLGTEQEQLTPADVGLGRDDAAVEILVAPHPSAAERLFAERRD